MSVREWSWKRWLLLAVLGLGLLAAVASYYVTFGIGGTRLSEGIASTVVFQSDMKNVPVALDVTPDGRFFIATTGKFSEGVGDNRWQSFWVDDDLASTSVADREAYIRKWIARGKLTEAWFTTPVDSVLVVDDADGDGVAERTRTFAEIQGMMAGVTAGVLVDGRDVYVASIPELIRYRDEDGDSRADVKTVLSEGYGLRTCFVGHDLHGLTWGPDGKIYFSIGDRGYNIVTPDGRRLEPTMDHGRGAVFRMNPDGSELEVFAEGLRNPQEIAFDNYGNLFTGDNNSDAGDAARIVYVVEGGDSGWMGPYQYQADKDYLRGPWNAEKLWHTAHPQQPAWIVPPIAEQTNGPSGMSFYPGLGLPERYQDHFFLSNYSFVPGQSYILSFGVEAAGAGFKLADVHKFASNELFIDQTFGYDGKMYALVASVIIKDRKVMAFAGEEESDDPRIAEMQRLFNEGFDVQSTERLLALLGHADQRVRREAQFTLAKRRVVEAIAAVAADRDAPRLQRIHALWGLGQQGSNALKQADWQDFTAFDNDVEVLAQALKVAGDARARWLAAPARTLLNHDNARVRYFAAMALGKLDDVEAIPALMGLLRDNNDEDAFLRHAAVWALASINEREAVWAYRDDSHRAVRMGVLLTLRRWQDSRIAAFLQDRDPLLVIEAARAIHDLPIDDAMSALATMATSELPLESDDPQTSYALHRRVVNANLRVGTEAAASALASYAGQSRHPKAMRKLALDALQQFTRPPVRDAVIGAHRPLAERRAELVYEALDRYMPALVKGELGDRAMEVALHYDRLPLSDEELVKLVSNGDESSQRRRSSLSALFKRRSAVLDQAMNAAAESDDAALRALHLQLLAELAPERARQRALAVVTSATSSDLREVQAAISLLGRLGGANAEAFLVAALHQLAAGDLRPEIQLDVVEAAQALNPPAVQEALAIYREAVSGDVMQERRIALLGGDAEHGKTVFENQGDCLRCHAINGRGGNAGPDLGGIAAKQSADELLESLVLPQARIAAGFGNVVLTHKDGSTIAGILLAEDEDSITLSSRSSHGEGEPNRILRADIVGQQGPFTGMPPMGLVLSMSDLRDVMAYLQTLDDHDAEARQ